MPAKLKQLQFERDTWKRLIGFMMEENVHLKNRLSEILKDKLDMNLLNAAEDFQSHFILEDELIGLLRQDIAELDKMLAGAVAGNKKILNRIDSRLTQLRKNIAVAETQFGKLKLDFNSYLSQIATEIDAW
jgi:RecJ-like exonuclease